MKTYSKNEKGFTLIELLVVISIIGLLSSIVLASLNEARQKATNSKVLQSANQLIRAIELYASDNGMYPGENLISSNYPIVRYSKKNDGTNPLASPLSFNLDQDLATYTSSVLESPINGQTYAYFTSDNIKCIGQDQSPRYLILIRKIGGFDADLPGYIINNNQTVTTDVCISGPEN